MSAAANPPQLILLMGVAGSGKTTVGKLLSAHLAFTFVDADDYHDDAAIARMRSGVALTAAMRDAWFERLVVALTDLCGQRHDCVLAFSGLRARHRRRMMHIGFATTAFMLGGSEALLLRRITQREEHFMPPSQLHAQLEAMEPLQDDERIELIDISAQPETIVAMLAARFRHPAT